MNGGLAIAILAAGSARRFGGGKLDAELNGRPLGSYAVAAVRALGKPKIMVGRPIPDFASAALALGEATLLKNRRAEEGLGTSVALAAMQASAAGADALLLLAADMPLVRAETLAALVAAVGEHPSAVLHPDGHPGIPACFPPGWYAKLAGLEGDQGAGKLLRDAEVTLVEVGPDELRDVDRPEDLSGIPLSKLR
ncbi:MAG: NTP transferase domain-containing protein [Candidatus Andeanibacterium colombiense]|uniref:NTP transferase domain-containing protein n=1 Tax=Candidatus Andeanibacterium colombiense TaxID=3121345 RepID=A0AAJ6BNU8_9SPHN|nr:MAG: NTP transferase domain-containing protein [Sphingomonadaceae bacterium]